MHAGTVEEAVAAGERLGWDVVLKATAERLRQRPDQAHVWRNIDNEEEMRDAWESLMGIISDPADAEFVVQRTAPPGVPVAIGGLEDPLFGPAVSFGISGALTDLVGDRVYRIPPISALDAAETVRAIKAAPLLFGYRGSEQVDVAAVEDLIRRVSQLKIDLPQVSQIDLMLVHATADGRERPARRPAGWRRWPTPARTCSYAGSPHPPATPFPADHRLWLLLRRGEEP